MFVLFIMIFAHIIDDFKLQGIMADMKCRLWWYNTINTLEHGEIYKYDYIVPLILHGFQWSMMVHSVFLLSVSMRDNPILYISIIINGLVHSFIDNLKANEFKINLIQDQLLHLIQIIVIYLILV